jgi:hypothetical protein
VLSNHNGHMFSSVDETVQPARNAVSDYISHTKVNMTKIEVSRKRIENDYIVSSVFKNVSNLRSSIPL